MKIAFEGECGSVRRRPCRKGVLMNGQHEAYSVIEFCGPGEDVFGTVIEIPGEYKLGQKFIMTIESHE